MQSQSRSAPPPLPRKIARSLTDAEGGQLEYVRIATRLENPGMDLANRTITLAKGGTVDVLAARESNMGPDRVSYTPGLKAWRKMTGDTITYRFSVPPDAPRGARYTVRALGSPKASPFAFTVEVGG